MNTGLLRNWLTSLLSSSPLTFPFLLIFNDCSTCCRLLSLSYQLCCSRCHCAAARCMSNCPTKAIHTFSCSLTLFLTPDCQQVQNGSNCHFRFLQLQSVNRHIKVRRCTPHTTYGTPLTDSCKTLTQKVLWLPCIPTVCTETCNVLPTQFISVRRIYGPYCSPNIVRVVKYKITRWAGHVARIELVVSQEGLCCKELVSCSIRSYAIGTWLQTVPSGQVVTLRVNLAHCRRTFSCTFGQLRPWKELGG
jgi:hypothetical protein